MANLNKMILIGRLTRDPVLNTSRSGNRFCSFGLAVNWKYVAADGSQKEETEFVDVITSSRDADQCNTYLRKGSTAYVEGRFRTRTWNDRNNVPHFVVELIASSIKFLDNRAPQQGPREEIEPSVERAFQNIAPASNVPPAPVAPLTAPPTDNQPPGDSIQPDDVF
ncbi:MAG: single-stranded DNA-binding protein [Lentisphaeria bacterium]|nr:single-stranded DNA-binding protein [Lentisphaeria bacterium]